MPEAGILLFFNVLRDKVDLIDEFARLIFVKDGI